MLRRVNALSVGSVPWDHALRDARALASASAQSAGTIPPAFHHQSNHVQRSPDPSPCRRCPPAVQQVTEWRRKPDLVITRKGSSTVTVLLGDGAAASAPAPTTPPEPSPGTRCSQTSTATADSTSSSQTAPPAPSISSRQRRRHPRSARGVSRSRKPHRHRRR